MAFVMRNLKKIENSNFWSYWTLEDSVLTVKKRDYFDNAKSILAVGNWLFITASTGSCILHVDEIDPLELGSPQ